MSERYDRTEKELASLERNIAKVYKKADAELATEIEAYFDQFRAADEQKRKQLEDGTITKAEYQQWQQKTMLTGNSYTALRDRIAKRYLKANQAALELINDTAPEVYAMNHNYEAYRLEGAVNGN